MALITPVHPTNAGAVTPFTASAPAGDEVRYSGGDVLIEFHNTHSSSITVQVAPTRTTGIVPGAGRVNIPTRSVAVAAGQHAVFLFKASEVRNYLNGNRRIPITYTGGNALLLMRALRVD